MTKKIAFIGGKGGVGKSTMAASLALAMASEQRVLLISTDPAHSLGDIFSQPFENRITALTTNLDVCEIDAAQEARQHVADVAERSRRFVNASSYEQVDNYFARVADSSSAQEAALFERLSSLLADIERYDHVVVDTAPTGHTLRLFFMPRLLRRWSKTLLTEQRRAGFNEDIIGHIVPDDAEAPQGHGEVRRDMLAILEERYLKYQRFEALLAKDSDIVFVLNPEPLAIAETQRAIHSLDEHGLAPSLLICNRLLPKTSRDPFLRTRIEAQRKHLAAIDDYFGEYPALAVSLQAQELREQQQYRRIGARILGALQSS